MCDCAKCITCGSDNIEATGKIIDDLDEYYCHNCEINFIIDWDKQDEIAALEKDEMEEEEEEEQY